jgi:hypothetical protein
MTRYLPPNLIALFEARAPIEFFAPAEHKKMPKLSGIGALISKFNDPPKGEPSPPPEVNTGIVPTLDEIRQRKRKRQNDEHLEHVSKLAKTCPYIYYGSKQYIIKAACSKSCRERRS